MARDVGSQSPIFLTQFSRPRVLRRTFFLHFKKMSRVEMGGISKLTRFEFAKTLYFTTSKNYARLSRRRTARKSGLTRCDRVKHFVM